MNIDKLRGKVIKSVVTRGREGYDDTPFVDIEFEDGTMVTIQGGYDKETGESLDKYRQYAQVGRLKKAWKHYEKSKCTGSDWTCHVRQRQRDQTCVEKCCVHCK